MPGRRASSSTRSWMGPSNTLRALAFDLRPELLPHPGDRVLRARRRLAVLLDGDAAGRRVPGHAPDHRRGAEHVGERLAQLVLLVLDLLDRELATRRERQLERGAVVRRRGDRFEVGPKDHLANLAQA